MSEIFGKLKSIKGKEITVLLDDDLIKNKAEIS